MPAPAAPNITFLESARAFAHAVRNPLAGAQLNLERLLTNSALGAGERDACGRAASCLRRIAVCVDDLLTLAAPRASRPREQNLYDFAKRYHYALAAAAQASGAALDVALPAPDATACFDADLLLFTLRRMIQQLAEGGAEAIRLEFPSAGAGAAVRAAAQVTNKQAPAAARGHGLDALIATRAAASFGGILTFDAPHARAATLTFSNGEIEAVQ